MLFATAPITPDDDEARRWLTEELAKAPYREAQPGPLELFWRAVLEWLQDALDGARALDADLGVLLLGAAALIVIALAIWLIRPKLNRRVRERGGVFEDERVLEAARHRALAADAARRNHFDLALTEILRAVIRTAEERVVIDPAPGRTVAEVAGLLESRFPDHAHAINWLTSRFSDVHYGGAEASAEDYNQALFLDQQLERAQPVHGSRSSASLAVPS